MRKLSKGIHFVVIKGIKRKVKVLASGKWRFMKMGRKKGKSRTTKSKRASNPKKKGRKMTKKNYRRRGARILGNLGIKGVLTGIVALTLTKFAIRKVGGGIVPPKYENAVAMVGAGLGGKAFGLNTKNLMSAGVVMGVSDLLSDLVFGGGIGLGMAPTRGYDL